MWKINKISVLAFYVLIVPAGLLSIWGMGGFMAAIGRVRGWNTNLTFWVSAIFYTLLLIGLYVAAVIANNAPDYSYDLTIRLPVLLILVIMIGLLLPLGILALHRMYPDAFNKVAPGHTTSK